MRNTAALACLLACVPLLASAAEVQLTSNPDGASVRIRDLDTTPQKGRQGAWVTPASADLARNRAGVPYVLEFSKDGYETQTVALDLRARAGPVHVVLAPLRVTREFTFATAPQGAAVVVDGRTVGQTPLRVPLTFRREGSRLPFPAASVRLELADHEGETVEVTHDYNRDAIEVELARLANRRSFQVTAVTLEGQPIEGAWVEVDGVKAGETPASIVLPFTRRNKESAWIEFRVSAHIPDEYERAERTVSVGMPGELRLELVPVSELNVRRLFPLVEMTGRGPRVAVDTSTTIGTAVDDRDENSPAARTTRITSFERKQANLQAVNSFALTPDGQGIVYAVTEREGDRYYSNLHLRSTNPSSPGVVRLTTGSRYLDCFPSMSREEGSSLVVFQSNRSGIESFDISGFRIREGRLVGGIQQLTREAQFNTRPSFTSEALPIFFCSLEAFPQAEPRLASVRSDGSAYTNLGEVAHMIACGEDGRIYFARPGPDTGWLQLYSIHTDGSGIESLLNDPGFAQSNCHSPALSLDGQRLLFVSDYDPDRAARKDNNIWMLNLDGSRQPVQITTNLSDDIQPVWSPTELDVIYFLSNRRGAYNIWQMTVSLDR